MRQILARLNLFIHRILLISLPIALVLLAVSNVKYVDKVCSVPCSLLLRVPSNNATDLIKTNHQSFGMYLVFAQLYKGKNIITPPNYWKENVVINPEMFTSWGGLNSVMYADYNPELSPEQFDVFAQIPSIKMDLYNNIDGSIQFFVFPIRNDEKTLAVFYRGPNVFIIPVDIVKRVIPGWEP
jgi:hypothetical protein